MKIKREDAARLGYDNAKAWMNLLRTNRNDIAAVMNISPGNFRWYAAYHDEDDHPHVHMMAWSTVPGEAYQTREGIRNIKSTLTNQIFRQEMLHTYEQKSQSRDELVWEARRAIRHLTREMAQSICSAPEIEQKMEQLATQLETVKGKKSYGYLPKPVKKTVDEIVDKLEEIPVVKSYYSYAKRDGVKEGFVPVLLRADDETLWECLILNSDPDSDGEDNYAFNPGKVAEYREKMLAAPLQDGKAVLEGLVGQRKEEAEDDDMDWDEEILGEMEGGYENRRFSSYWNSDSKITYPLILAKIPVKNPWEIFAYLPFGGWNECPNTPELMAVAKYWFEQHGAVPAAMTHDELEFTLPAPVPEEKAMGTAVEQYGFCPDVVDQEEDPTVGNLADVLRQSTVWYFWWD